MISTATGPRFSAPSSCARSRECTLAQTQTVVRSESSITSFPGSAISPATACFSMIVPAMGARTGRRPAARAVRRLPHSRQIILRQPQHVKRLLGRLQVGPVLFIDHLRVDHILLGAHLLLPESSFRA